MIWFSVDDEYPVKNGKIGIDVIAECDYGDGPFYNIVNYYNDDQFNNHGVKFWAYIPKRIESNE